MLKIYLLASFIFFSLANCFGQSTLGFSLMNGKTRVEIPIEIHNNLVVVPVVLNGTLPLKFIVDTGVRTSILTQKTFSDILNLKYSKKYSISGPGGKKIVDAYITNNVSLQLPGVTGKGHALLVLEEDYLELRNYLGVDVHGILGYELFSRFIVMIDYEKKLLTLMTPERFRAGRKYEAVPMRIEDTKPYILAPIILDDGTQLTAKLLVDSGASHGLLLDPDSDDRIKAPSHWVSSSIGRGLGGEISGKVGRVRVLQLGKISLKEPIANFPDPNSYFDSLKMGIATRNGTIGGEVFSRFTVVFNFPKEIIYLKKNHSFKKPFHYNLSGITIKAKGSRLNVFEVTEVRNQSAACKAGIKQGDIILSMNGIPAGQLNLSIMQGMLNLRPGKKIHFNLERKGVRLRVDFKLEDEI